MRPFITRFLHIAALLSLVTLSLLSYPMPAHAATVIRVSTTTDEAGSNSGSCSLREAIIAANENKAFGGCPSGSAGLDTIIVPGSTKKYALTIKGANEDITRTGDLDILESIQIMGDGAEKTIVSGGLSDRVFHILTNGTVLFSGVTVTEGHADITGGGVYARYGKTTLSKVTLSGNDADLTGGGMRIYAGASATIENSFIWNNTADRGGGIMNEGSLTMNRSLLVGNEATDTAGGVYITSYSTSNITNSTIAQNTAPAGNVGGIWVTVQKSLILLNSTIVDNEGVGLQVEDYATGNIKNTIIGRQTEENCSINPLSTFSSAGHNLTTDSTCGFSGAGDAVVASANLGLSDALADNGGPTATYALVEGGPAVDKGDNNGCPMVDQRGFGRPMQGTPPNSPLVCDIGAFELNGKAKVNLSYVPFIRK